MLNGDWDKVYSEDDRNEDFTMYFSYEDFLNVAEGSGTSLSDIPQLYISAGSSDMTAYALYAEPVQKSVKGDVNADGEFSVADVVVMQKWLLCVQDTALVNREAGNLCEDDRLDVLDLCIMKRELLNK